MGNANEDTRKGIAMGAENLRQKVEELLERQQVFFMITRSDLNAANYYLRTLVTLLENDPEKATEPVSEPVPEAE